jgi:hypothetical protein
MQLHYSSEGYLVIGISMPFLQVHPALEVNDQLKWSGAVGLVVGRQLLGILPSPRISKHKLIDLIPTKPMYCYKYSLNFWCNKFL